MSRRGWTLLVVSAGTALLLLDVTAVNVAIPSIRKDLDASFSSLQWVVDAYALTLASTLLLAGALADRLGRRRLFVAGLALFAVSSLGCAAANSGTALDVARGIQGIGAAAMFATSLALLANEFRGRDRGTALGVWGAITGAALAVGPLVGGALVDGFSWRAIFLVNVPLGLLLGVAARARLAESRQERPSSGLDWTGGACFTGAAALIVYGLIRGNPDGWGSPAIVASLAGGVLLAVTFVLVELRQTAPMLDVRLFRIPAFSGTALVAFSQSFALYPMFLFLAIYFQDVLRYSPLGSGLRVLPVTIALFLVAPLSGKLTGRIPVRVLLCAGLILIGTGLLLMRRLEPGSDWTVLLPGFVVGGVGIGVISPALAAAMVGVLSAERAGLASGINNTFRQLGIGVGIAGLGAIFQHDALAGASLAEGMVTGLDAIFLVSAAVALASVIPAYVLCRRLLAVSPAGEA